MDIFKMAGERERDQLVCFVTEVIDTVSVAAGRERERAEESDMYVRMYACMYVCVYM